MFHPFVSSLTVPCSTINLGKFGSFQSSQIIGRPYHLTFEILEKSDSKSGKDLRVVPASELHAETLLEEAEPQVLGDDATPAENQDEFDDYGLPATTEKSNVNILDDTKVQKLTFQEIEALKSGEAANPRELIAKIMANHSQLDQKTAFSLAKYTLRKQKKYMRRFTVLPLDTAMLVDYMMNEKEFGRIMEIRNETLALLGSWANVHAAPPVAEDEAPQCRYLMVDDTGGLVTAAIAERMGILHHDFQPPPQAEHEENEDSNEPNGSLAPKRKVYDRPLATSNTIHLVHANQQPNLAMLRYFGYDPNTPPSATDSTPAHPLHTHLKTLTWLQLLDPTSDTTYANEPPSKTSDELTAMKPNHRSTYHRKRRRWQRAQSVVDETRAGGFNALIVASYTSPISICRHLIPLLAGGAQIVVYYPYIEPLLPLVDAYATARRTAFLQLEEERKEEVRKEPTEEFPVDPTLTLGFMMQTARVKRWQVLPGRTHPLMTSKGGSEGFVASATRVVPVRGKVQARGKQGRPRKRKAEGSGGASEVGDREGDGDVEMAEDSAERVDGDGDVEVKTDL